MRSIPFLILLLYMIFFKSIARKTATISSLLKIYPILPFFSFFFEYIYVYYNEIDSVSNFIAVHDFF